MLLEDVAGSCPVCCCVPIVPVVLLVDAVPAVPISLEWPTPKVRSASLPSLAATPVPANLAAPATSFAACLHRDAEKAWGWWCYNMIWYYTVTRCLRGCHVLVITLAKSRLGVRHLFLCHLT